MYAFRKNKETYPDIIPLLQEITNLAQNISYRARSTLIRVV